jgi:hypothetical protein
LRGKGQMEFVVPQVIGLLPIPKPSQFQLVCRIAVAEEDKDEAAVVGRSSRWFIWT